MSNILSIEPYLYQGNTITEILNLYVAALRQDSSETSPVVAAKLQEVLAMISDTDFLSEIRIIFEELYQKICETSPDLCFVLEGRRKSLLSTVAKIEALLESHRSVDNLQDVYGFRLTLLDSDPWDQLENRYQLMNGLIPFFMQKGFIPCDSAPLLGTAKFKAEDHPELAIPSTELLRKEFRYAVKDYVRHPKRNGYQSLHVAFRDPTKWRYFEIQVRTFSMHVAAEVGTANHMAYKDRFYGGKITFDPKKVNLKGFRAIDDNTVYDMIGLTRSLRILSRQRTFPN